MRIFNETRMVKNKVYQCDTEKYLLSTEFREQLNGLYMIENNNPFESSVNSIAVATDLSFALNVFNGNQSAISRPIRLNIEIEDTKSGKIVEKNPLESIIVEVNGNIYDITNGEMYNTNYHGDCMISEDYNANPVEITPSDKYTDIVEILEYKK